ncbi:MAG: 1-acyl-sn-glycerol-3-phosphate acyltransferase [Nitrospirota bacterium]|nr:1-acyl-sn-glycerol-3-phosphate acyltransferase [Nitrospirota bacterium]
MAEGRFSYRFVKKLLYLFLRLYCRVEYAGRENIPVSGPLVVAGNHSSYFDPFFISVGMRRVVRYMAIERFFRMPVIGWCMRIFGAFPVYQQGVDKEAVATAIDILEKGGTFGIFPEGGLSLDGKIRSPKLGMAMIAATVGVPILPVTISGSFTVFPKGKLFPRPRKVRVTFHPPVNAAKGSDKKELRDISHHVMERIREGYEVDLKG